MQNVQGLLILNFYALIMLIITSFIFFRKDRQKQIEDQTYAKLLIVTTLVSISGIILGIFVSPTAAISESWVILFNKIYLVCLLLWITILTFYTLCISVVKNTRALVKVFVLITLFNIVMITCLPISVDIGMQGTVSSGPAIIYTYMCFALGFICQIVCIILDFKHIKSKKYIPIYMLAFFGIIVLVIQMLFPWLNYLINPALILITFIMYHTIENPDVKIIKELNRNKNIIEKNSQGTSNFMFNLTTESRQYINTITKICTRALQANDKAYYENAFRNVLEKTKEAETKINTIMDVSAIDIKNIKVTNKEYSIVQVLDEIRMQNESKINDNIEFVINISPNLPDKLYGDQIRVKQVISSLLANAIKNTKEGFISLEVNTIIKYDICRIILSVEDSGKGIDLEKVNDILSSNDNINSEEIATTDTLDMNLKTIKKIMKMLGGSLLLTSEEGKGTKVTIVLDQKIADDINQEFEAKISDYSKKLGVQKVLIVDDDLKELNSIQEYFNNLGVESVGTMYGKDCLDRIRVGQSYDVIILDDDMNSVNAINIMQELKENKKFKTPIIVMLEESKLSISKHYVEEGFTDYIDKSKLEAEMKRVVNDYLN